MAEVLSWIFSHCYLVASLILGALWTVLYLLRPDLRKKILLSSIIAAPLGATEVIFVPQYWSPRFPCIRLFRDDLYLESFLFSFFLGGVAAALYQALFRKPLFDTHRMNQKAIYLAPFLFFSFALFPHINLMYFCLASFLVLSALLWIGEPRLIVPMLSNGLLLMGFAALCFYSARDFYAQTLSEIFNYADLSGIRVFGVAPIEELLFYLGMGTLWSVFYELVGNSRYRKLFSRFYERDLVEVRR